MKVWEALQILEKMDHTLEVTLSFPVDKPQKVYPQTPKHDWVIDREHWLHRTHGVEKTQRIH